MVRLDERAERNISALSNSFEAKGRPEATRNLRRAVVRAAERIEQRAGMGLAAPRPYPDIARAGVRWLKEGRYWFAYSTADDPVILAVIYDQANIPRRL